MRTNRLDVRVLQRKLNKLIELFQIFKTVTAHQATFNMLRKCHMCLTLTVIVTKQDAHHLLGHAKRRATKIRTKAVGCGIFGRFSNFHKCRSEVAGDVISGVAVD